MLLSMLLLMLLLSKWIVKNILVMEHVRILMLKMHWRTEVMKTMYWLGYS